jgi:two-component system alkaline phosphatase synthesis response regulator PhoP
MASVIYSVEDDESIRELISYALVNAGFQVSSFATAEKMLKEFEQKTPDLVILDIMLPGLDGIEALKQIREKNKSIKIIMLTAKKAEHNKVQGLDSGADDYITKPFSVLELVARVKAHLRTQSKSGDTITCSGLVVNPSARTVTSNGKPVMLTYKEFELLLALIKKAGTVVTREELLHEVWGYEYYGESRTVDIHIKNLRTKLGKGGDCIVSVRGVGYTVKNIK